MLRLTEIAMFVSPFLLFGAWRFAVARGIPSTAMVAVAAGVLMVMFGVLLWFSQEGALRRDVSYVPAQLQDGRIVPGHGAR
jgi:Family of unknown function (DUF6111)